MSRFRDGLNRIVLSTLLTSGIFYSTGCTSLNSNKTVSSPISYSNNDSNIPENDYITYKKLREIIPDYHPKEEVPKGKDIMDYIDSDIKDMGSKAKDKVNDQVDRYVLGKPKIEKFKGGAAGLVWNIDWKELSRFFNSQ